MTDSKHIPTKEAQAVLDKISRDEVIKLALALANIDSPNGHEKEVLEFIYSWLQREGLSPVKVGMLEDRYNVIGRLKGTGVGYTLLFNSHVDTNLSREDIWIQTNLDDPVWHSAWQDGDMLIGYGIVNDKGPLASAMIAARAIKQSGVQLRGDVLVTGVISETSSDPVDEFQPPRYYSREIGAEYMVSHGVLADYALVGESTSHGYSRVLSGMAGYKLSIALEGTYSYIPYLKRPTTMIESPNAIVRMGKAIEVFEDWAYRYQTKYTTQYEGATVIPKASIVGIRGGHPTAVGSVIAVCSMYIKAFTPPDFNPLIIPRELMEAMRQAGLAVKIEPYAFRPGFEARNSGVLTDAIEKAHQTVFDEKTRPINPEIPSMWRDCNVFNSFGIPSVTYGPGGGVGSLPKGAKFGMPADELYNFARTYALIALDVCNRERI